MCIKGKKACTCKVEGSKNVNLFKEEKSNINMAGHLILDSRTSDQLYSLHKKKKKKSTSSSGPFDEAHVQKWAKNS